MMGSSTSGVDVHLCQATLLLEDSEQALRAK
jgi:hypothetical protein